MAKVNERVEAIHYHSFCRGKREKIAIFLIEALFSCCKSLQLALDDYVPLLLATNFVCGAVFLRRALEFFVRLAFKKLF